MDVPHPQGSPMDFPCPEKVAQWTALLESYECLQAMERISRICHQMQAILTNPVPLSVTPALPTLLNWSRNTWKMLANREKHPPPPRTGLVEDVVRAWSATRHWPVQGRLPCGPAASAPAAPYPTSPCPAREASHVASPNGRPHVLREVM